MSAADSTAGPPQFLLAHQGTGSFVQEVALALHEGGMLGRFATTVLDRPNAAWRRALTALPIAGAHIERELQRRRVPAWLEARSVTFPGLELLRVLASRLGPTELAHQVYLRSEPAFDRWVARGHLEGMSGVYGFVQPALATFRKAKKRGMFVALDLPTPSQELFGEVIARELARWPELATPYMAKLAARTTAPIADIREQIALADCVIANSRFTLESYQRHGYAMQRAIALPLGAPHVVETAHRTEPTKTARPLRLLSASALSVLKGGHVLLEAFHRETQKRSQLDPIELTICGRVALPDSFVRARSRNVTLRGHVPQAELASLYLSSDALVLPTLADGFGLVVSEALAHGLPVITTDQCGAADLITPSVHGLITRAGDVESLREAIAFCADQRDALAGMRAHAIARAREHNWPAYRSALRETLTRAYRAR